MGTGILREIEKNRPPREASTSRDKLSTSAFYRLGFVVWGFSVLSGFVWVRVVGVLEVRGYGERVGRPCQACIRPITRFAG